MHGGTKRFGRSKNGLLLLVGDDVQLRGKIATLMLSRGYSVELAEGVARAQKLATSSQIVLTVVLVSIVTRETLQLARDLAQIGSGSVVVVAQRVPVGMSPDDVRVVEAANPPKILAFLDAELERRDEAESEGDQDSAVFKFGEYCFDLAAHVLRRSRGGEIALTSSEYSLLSVLVSNPGRVLSRDQIRNALSGRGMDAYDRSIDVLISRLRRKIERNIKRPEIIATVPGTGYKFSVPVEVTTGTARSQDTQGPQQRRLTVGVMPFETFSDSGEIELLSAGLTDDLITQLSSGSEIAVLSKNSLAPYKAKPADIRELGRDLNARYFLEGSIRLVENQLRVAVQLTDVDDASHVWAERFDFEYDGRVLRLQDRLSQAIVSSVRHKLTTETTLQTVPSRRLTTVLCCRLDGAAEWSEDADPLVLSRVLGRYQAASAQVIQRYGGVISCVLPDTIEAHFNLSVSLERSAEHAVRAAMEIEADIGLNEDTGQGALSFRAGIATGTAVFGTLASSPFRSLAGVGRSVVVARRLAAISEPGSVYICLDTRTLLGGLFACQPAGCDGFRVTSQAPTKNRFLAFQNFRYSPLVGRAAELGQLAEAWQNAVAGSGRIAVISGDPGIGKSRLLAALRDQIADNGCKILHFACMPDRADAAFSPFLEQIEDASGLHAADSAAERTFKLHHYFACLGYPEQDLDWLASELRLIPQMETATSHSPQQRRQRIIDFLLAYLELQAVDGPVLLEFEDLHWADFATLDVVAHFIERLRQLRVMLVVTSRPSFVPPWPEPGHALHLQLFRLNAQHSRKLAEWVAGERLDAESLNDIVERADGIPLFIEELSRVRTENRNAARPIPLTLEASLFARLDQLPLSISIAEVAAAIGRQFSHELIASISSQPEIVLNQALEELSRAGLIFRRGTPPDATYTFKHALLRDAIYQRLSHTARIGLHKAIVDGLERSLPGIAESQPGLVAFHATEGQLFRKAVDYAFRAGRHAVGIAAMREAIGQLHVALTALNRLPENPSRDVLELDISIALLTALVPVSGYTSEETQETYRRANALCAKIGSLTKLENVEHGIFRQYLVEANYSAALRLASDASSAGRQGWELGTGIIKMHQGELINALNWLERANEAIRAEPNTEHLEILRLIGAPAYLALCHALLGAPSQARALVDEALAIGAKSKHATAQAFALSTTARVTWLLGDISKNRQIADELLRLCRRHDFGYWLANAECYLGWHDAAAGRAEAGASLIMRGLHNYRATKARWLLPFFLGMAAEVHFANNSVVEAIALLEEALRERAETGERWFDGRLLWLKASLLRKTDRTAEAEVELISARDIVENQGAELFRPLLRVL